MRGGKWLGLILFVIGILILYLLRNLLVQVIILALGLLGLLIGFGLVIVGLGLIFWRRAWR